MIWDFCMEVLLPVVFLCLLVTIPLGGCIYYASYREAKIINEEFGTNYSVGDIFWTSEAIEKIILGEKQRLSGKIKIKNEGGK